MVIRAYKKYHWIKHKKIKYYVITSDRKKLFQTSEASEVLINKQIFNTGHIQLEKILLYSVKKKITTS